MRLRPGILGLLRALLLLLHALEKLIAAAFLVFHRGAAGARLVGLRSHESEHTNHLLELTATKGPPYSRAEALQV